LFYQVSCSFRPLCVVLRSLLACAQLYVNRDRQKSEDILKRVAKAGYKVRALGLHLQGTV